MTYKQIPEFQPFSLAVQRAINHVDLLQASGIFYISPSGKSSRIRPCARRPAMHIVFYGLADDSNQNWEQLARSEALGWGVALGGAVLALGAVATAPIWVPAAAAGGAAVGAVTVAGTLAAGVGAGVASYKFGALIGASETGNKQAYLDTVGGAGLKRVEFWADVVALATGLSSLPAIAKNIKHLQALRKLGAAGGDPMQLIAKLKPEEMADVTAAFVEAYRSKTPQMAAFFQRQGIHSEAELLAKMASMRAGAAASKAVTHYVKKHVPVAVLNAKIKRALAQELFNLNGVGQGVALSAQNGAIKSTWDDTKGIRNGVSMHTDAMLHSKHARDTISLKSGESNLEVWWAIFQADPSFAH